MDCAVEALSLEPSARYERTFETDPCGHYRAQWSRVVRWCGDEGVEEKCVCFGIVILIFDVWFPIIDSLIGDYIFDLKRPTKET